jgi:hypothetical protein
LEYECGYTTKDGNRRVHEDLEIMEKEEFLFMHQDTGQSMPVM